MERKERPATWSLFRQAGLQDDVQQGAVAVVLLFQPHGLRLVLGDGPRDGGHDLRGDRAQSLGHEKFELLDLARGYAARALHGLLLEPPQAKDCEWETDDASTNKAGNSCETLHTSGVVRDRDILSIRASMFFSPTINTFVYIFF